MTTQQIPPWVQYESRWNGSLEARINTHAIAHELSGQALHRAKRAEADGRLRTVATESRQDRGGPDATPAHERAAVRAESAYAKLHDQ